MDEQSKKQALSADRQAALVFRVEEALSASALGLLTSAEARYAAAVSATTAPVTVTTTRAA